MFCDFYVLLWLFTVNNSRNRILLGICIFMKKNVSSLLLFMTFYSLHAPSGARREFVD